MADEQKTQFVAVTRLDELLALAAPGVRVGTDADVGDVLEAVGEAGQLDAFVDLMIRDAAAQPAIGVVELDVPEESDRIPCPACGQADLELVDQVTRWQPVRCARSGQLVVEGVADVDDGTGAPAVRCSSCRATWAAPEYVDDGF